LYVFTWRTGICNWLWHVLIVAKLSFADHLAVVASKIIFQQQRGFVNDMHIVDCIIIVFEAINVLHREAIWRQSGPQDWQWKVLILLNGRLLIMEGFSSQSFSFIQQRFCVIFSVLWLILSRIQQSYQYCVRGVL
jgi:hypothetical protein